LPQDGACGDASGDAHGFGDGSGKGFEVAKSGSRRDRNALFMMKNCGKT